MIRHFSHIFFVEGLTFIVFLQFLCSCGARGRVPGQATVSRNRSVGVVAGDGALASNRLSATERAVRPSNDNDGRVLAQVSRVGCAK